MSAARERPPGALAIVLHSHMPYVEGFGTWPFGEEWLWEAVACVYLPLLDVLDGAPVTLGLTPVLCDQFEAMRGEAGDRYLRFLREIRAPIHDEDAAGLDDSGEPELAAEVRRAAGDYTRPATRFEEHGRDLLSAFAGLSRVELWTSAATHGLLPLMATDAGLRLQVATGSASHMARFGDWDGGFWLPECAHDPALDRLLEEAGATHTCVELTDLGIDPRQPLRSPAGPLLVPIDRALIDLVWGPDGYPSRGAYLNTRRYTERRHLAWSVDGAPYDPGRAVAQARDDAEHFIGRAEARLAGGGACVVALDTELLGHWWVEGVEWLDAVLALAADADLDLLPADPEHLGEPVDAPALPVTTWGKPRTLATWSGPGAGGLAWRQRAAELAVLAAGEAAGERALRELLALQSSDWAFLSTHGTAGPYPGERAAGHEAALAAALADPEGADPALRGLAPWLEMNVMREP